MTATTGTEKDKNGMNEELKSIQEQVQTVGTENTRLKYQLEEKVRVLQATMKENSRLKETVKECREELKQKNSEPEVLGMELENYDFVFQEHRKENEKLNEALKLARQKTTAKRKNEAEPNTSQRSKVKKLEPNHHVSN